MSDSTRPFQSENNPMKATMKNKRTLLRVCMTGVLLAGGCASRQPAAITLGPSSSGFGKSKLAPIALGPTEGGAGPRMTEGGWWGRHALGSQDGQATTERAIPPPVGRAMPPPPRD